MVGSPKLPMTPEAVLLNVLDDLEAKMQAMRNEFAKARRPVGRGREEMTDWVRSLEQPVCWILGVVEGGVVALR